MFNHIKGIHKPMKEGEFDEDWLKNKATKQEKDKWNAYDKFCQSNGIIRPKVKYPVLFGKGDNTYPGVMATEDIKPHETII